jgi:hypothetical protein
MLSIALDVATGSAVLLTQASNRDCPTLVPNLYHTLLTSEAPPVCLFLARRAINYHGVWNGRLAWYQSFHHCYKSPPVSTTSLLNQTWASVLLKDLSSALGFFFVWARDLQDHVWAGLHLDLVINTGSMCVIGLMSGRGCQDKFHFPCRESNPDLTPSISLVTCVLSRWTKIKKCNVLNMSRSRILYYIMFYRISCVASSVPQPGSAVNC